LSFAVERISPLFCLADFVKLKLRALGTSIEKEKYPWLFYACNQDIPDCDPVIHPVILFL